MTQFWRHVELVKLSSSFSWKRWFYCSRSSAV